MAIEWGWLPILSPRSNSLLERILTLRFGEFPGGFLERILIPSLGEFSGGFLAGKLIIVHSRWANYCISSQNNFKWRWIVVLFNPDLALSLVKMWMSYPPRYLVQNLIFLPHQRQKGSQRQHFTQSYNEAEEMCQFLLLSPRSRKSFLLEFITATFY